MGLEFDEATHTYKIDGKEVPSVTTFVKSFFPKFDSKLLSKKVAEAVAKEIIDYRNGIISIDKMPKSERLFGDNLQKELDKRINKRNPITARRVELLWEKKRDESAKKGTQVHAEIEAYLGGNLAYNALTFPMATKAIDYYKKLTKSLEDPREFAELRLGDKETELAGTIDLFISHNSMGDSKKGSSKRVVTLVDWKTNEEIKDKGYNKVNLNGELFEDCNYVHYMLQLSTYAYLVEKTQGEVIANLLLIHLSDDKVKVYKIPYRKDVIEWMVKNK